MYGILPSEFEKMAMMMDSNQLQGVFNLEIRRIAPMHPRVKRFHMPTYIRPRCVQMPFEHMSFFMSVRHDNLRSVRFDLQRTQKKKAAVGFPHIQKGGSGDLTFTINNVSHSVSPPIRKTLPGLRGMNLHSEKNKRVYVFYVEATASEAEYCARICNYFIA